MLYKCMLMRYVNTHAKAQQCFPTEVQQAKCPFILPPNLENNTPRPNTAFYRLDANKL